MTNAPRLPSHPASFALARTLLTTLVVMVTFGLLAGCPTGAASGGPVETCTELAQQCRLRDGLLGVCTATEGDCAEPPCLICRPQH